MRYGTHSRKSSGSRNNTIKAVVRQHQAGKHLMTYPSNKIGTAHQHECHVPGTNHVLGEGIDRMIMTELNTEYNLNVFDDYRLHVENQKDTIRPNKLSESGEEGLAEQLAMNAAVLYKSPTKSKERKTARPWTPRASAHKRKALKGAKSSTIYDTNSQHCTCCKGSLPECAGRVHFPNNLTIGGPTRPSYDRQRLLPEERQKQRSRIHPYPTGKMPVERRQSGNLKFLPCLIGIGEPTKAYSERSRLDPSLTLKTETQPKTCLSVVKENWEPTHKNEFELVNEEHHLSGPAPDDTNKSYSVLTCCDMEGRGGQALREQALTAQSLPPFKIDLNERHATMQAEHKASISETNDKVTITSHEKPHNHIEGSKTKAAGSLEAPALAYAIMQIQNAHQRASMEKAHRIALQYSNKAWSAISRKTKRKVRRARKLLLAIDTGANVNTCTSEAAALYSPGSVSPSGIEIGGLSASAKIDEKGELAGQVSLDDGSSLLVQHRDVHHCRSSTMNLLSASRLTNQGIRCVFAEKGAKGGSYLLLPLLNGTRRRVPLLENNGLYFLEMDILYGDDENEIKEMFSFVTTQEAPRKKSYTLTTNDKPVAYSVAADLQLWHERLGHTNIASLKLIYRTGGIDGFEIDHDPEHKEQCQCPTCMMTKAQKQHMPNKPRAFDPNIGKPLQDIVSDVKVIGADSMNGARYFVTFIDVWSRHCTAYFLEKKSDVSQAWSEYLAWTRREGYVVKTITTDNGGEYWSKQTESGELLVDEETLAQFENVCQNNGTGLPITHIKTAGPNHSDMNPIAERYNRKIMDIANAQMYHAKLSTGFWEWSVRHAVYLINRIPLKFHAKYHKSKTAYELITRQVASYSRIRTFGCDMYQRLPKGPRSSEPGYPNARKLLYLGISDDGKAYIGYDVEASNPNNEVRHVFDVRFDEDMRNRTNNLRAYDERRKLEANLRPTTFNEWDDDATDSREHVRSLYDLYVPKTVTDASNFAEPQGSAGDKTVTVPTKRLGSVGATPTPQLNHHGSEEGKVEKTTNKSNREVENSPVTSDEESDSNSDTESDNDSDTDNYMSDISEDDYDEDNSKPSPPVSRRKSLRRASRSRIDRHQPTTIQKSLSQARLDGPFTEQRLREIQNKEQIEPPTLIRPPRFSKPGVYDKKRPQHLVEADNTFLRAAYEHNYKIHVSQSYSKRKGSASAHRFDLVKPATSMREYLELATASLEGKDHRTIASAISKAKQDFKYEYDRGLIKFPERESGHHSHYCDAELLAERYQVTRVADTISKNQTNYYANIADMSFNQLVAELYHAQDAVDWIETKERMAVFGRKSMDAFITRSLPDLTANLVNNLEPQGMSTETHITPNHYGGAKKSKDREQWEKAMDEELTNCREMGTWDLVPQSVLPPNADLVDCRWVYKIKTNSKGDIARWRARIVARGYSQRPGVDYNEEEVYAPVVGYDTIRTCLAIATATDIPRSAEHASSAGGVPIRGLEIRQADIKNAYLIGSLDSPIYMRQPPSARMKLDKFGRPLICKLLRPLYGLKQSGHIFASVLHTFLCEDLQMHKLVSDKCAFVKDGNPSTWSSKDGDAHSVPDPTTLDQNGTQLIVLTYVDDLTIIGNKEQCDWFMAKLRARFTMQDLETGEIEFILSMAVKRDREKGTLTLNQRLAIEKIAEKMEITTTNSVETAMCVTPLTKLEAPETDPKVANWPYLETVGSLLHISQCTRPDIAYAVGSLARHSTTLGAQHIKAAKRCVQYLYNTRELCLKYSAGKDEDTNEPEVYEAGRRPHAYADADYAGETQTRKSTSGGIIFLNGGPITWSSKLQKIVAQSTAEAEIIAATEITKEIIHLKLLLTELGARKDRVVYVHEDNQACILMGNNMKSSRSAKHYEIRLHFLQESIQKKVIKFKYCPTDVMIADALTKPLDKEKFLFFREKLLSPPL